MRQKLAFLTAAVIALLVVNPVGGAPSTPGIGDQLSLSITNKYGDVLANPTVAQILADGLVVQTGTTVMKVKYNDLPPDISNKYQALAAGVIKREEKQGAANAAYFAYTEQLQVKQARHLAAQEEAESEQAKERAADPSTNMQRYLSITIPNQNWKLVIADMGFSSWTKLQDNDVQFVMRGQPGPSGFNLILFVDNPANGLGGNDPVYNFFWSNLSHDASIDAQSVKVERADKFIKVFYTAHGQPNANYFFACQGKWVDLHLWKPSYEPADDKLFAKFDNSLSYGE
jgi:hypothetical protein